MLLILFHLFPLIEKKKSQLFPTLLNPYEYLSIFMKATNSSQPLLILHNASPLPTLFDNEKNRPKWLNIG